MPEGEESSLAKTRRIAEASSGTVEVAGRKSSVGKLEDFLNHLGASGCERYELKQEKSKRRSDRVLGKVVDVLAATPEGQTAPLRDAYETDHEPRGIYRGSASSFAVQKR